MSLNAKEVPMSGGGDRNRPDPLEPGTYPARLVQVLLLGTQPQRPYKGEEKPPKLEIMLTYELLDEFLKDENGEDIDDKPRWLSETLPFNNLESELAKSTKRYFALDPDVNHGGDWARLVGTPCMVTVIVEEGKGKNAGRSFENISAVSSMRPKEAQKAPELVNAPRVFDFFDPDIEVFNALPDWLKDKIKGAVDFGGSELERLLSGKNDRAKPPADKKAKEELDDEIPW